MGFFEGKTLGAVEARQAKSLSLLPCELQSKSAFYFPLAKAWWDLAGLARTDGGLIPIAHGSPKRSRELSRGPAGRSTQDMPLRKGWASERRGGVVLKPMVVGLRQLRAWRPFGPGGSPEVSFARTAAYDPLIASGRARVQASKRCRFRPFGRPRMGAGVREGRLCSGAERGHERAVRTLKKAGAISDFPASVKKLGSMGRRHAMRYARRRFGAGSARVPRDIRT
jgi:hypothetical protein